MDIRDCTVVCVIVTRDRPHLLRRALAAVTSQSRRPDHLVVVDNGSSPEVEGIVRGAGLPATYLPSRANLGGAGGFAYGVLTARALGADWVWLADDDGRAADRWTLARLMVCAEDNDLDAVSPLVLDEDQPDLLAFPLRRGLRWVRRSADLGEGVLIDGVANLFNGALFSATAIDAVGVPDPRLFVRGDEVEMHRRLRRSGLRFGTCSAAGYLHPQGREDWVPVLGGALSVLVPGDEGRQEVTYRNLGYLTSQPGLRWRRLPDAARYTWYFLAQERDPAGLARWRRLSRDGRRERFRGSTSASSGPVAMRRAG